MVQLTSSIRGLNIWGLLRLMTPASSDFESSSMPLIKMTNTFGSGQEQESKFSASKCY